MGDAALCASLSDLLSVSLAQLNNNNNKQYIYITINKIWISCSPFPLQDNKGTESEHINLKVLGQDNAVVQFKIKKHTPLRKLMNAYCDRAVSNNCYYEQLQLNIYS